MTRQVIIGWDGTDSAKVCYDCIFHKLILICSFADWSEDAADAEFDSPDNPGESAQEEAVDDDEPVVEECAVDSTVTNKRKRPDSDSPGSTHKPKRPPVSNRDPADTWNMVVQVVSAGNHN